MPRRTVEAAPDNRPQYTTAHRWVAACVVDLAEVEVPKFQRKASMEFARNGRRREQSKVAVRRPVEVLDVYCRRCATRPGQQGWCPYDLSADLGLPRD